METAPLEVQDSEDRHQEAVETPLVSEDLEGVVDLEPTAIATTTLHLDLEVLAVLAVQLRLKAVKNLRLSKFFSSIYCFVMWP